MSLLDQVCHLDNLDASFARCFRGRMSALGAHKVYMKLDAMRFELARNLRLGRDYPWGEHREFFVADPKRRLISAAPFIDRVAHRALFHVMDPL